MVAGDKRVRRPDLEAIAELQANHLPRGGTGWGPGLEKRSKHSGDWSTTNQVIQLPGTLPGQGNIFSLELGTEALTRVEVQASIHAS